MLHIPFSLNIGQSAQSNIDVTLGETGFNPYRVSQFENADPWIKAGMSPETANSYLGAIGVSLNSSNMVLDLTIPHNQQYIEALDAIRADFLANKITKEQAIQQIEQKCRLRTKWGVSLNAPPTVPALG